ncbi:MAG: MFS transporter [Mycobacterium sp.]
MTSRQRAALFVLCLAVLMVAVDGTVISVAVPAITEQLRPDYNQILWIGDIYAFVIAGLLITMGNVGDRIGRKRLLLIAAVAFGVASVAAAVAPSAGLLIAARALQGVAGAGLMPSTLALLRTVFRDERQRIRAVGIWSASGAAGAALGPTIAGALLEHFYWGSVLLVNVPVVLLILGVGLGVLPEARSDTRHPLDPLSVVYSTVGILAAVLGIKELAHSGPGYWPAYLALAAGAVLLAVFLRRQGRLRIPLLDLNLFSQSGFGASVLAQLVIVFANTGALFFLPIFLRQVQGFSPLQSGMATLPESLASLVAASTTVHLVGRWGHRRALVVGLVAGTTGILLLGAAAPVSYVAMVIPLIMLGFSFGLVVTSASDLVLMSASEDRAGAATGVSETAFELGTALGIAITGSVISVFYLVLSGTPANFSETVEAAAFTTSLTAGCVAIGIVMAAVTAAIAVALRRPRDPVTEEAPPVQA